MADITLRDYLAKLDSLLKSGAASEVIHHCRHILQYFPKNADTYRFLGRALVENKSWREADEVLRRLLSVYPDDFYAHIGLSEVSMADKRPDDAIWFLERAFEQEPNNEVILDELREMYRKHRRIEHAKVQLTAGAVAQQYVRNGLFAQAVTTLQQALANAPDRIDLKLLLARTYWNAGQRIEGAETAVSVLQALPDCLEANRILAELWLGESRPSDAQRYISNIQSVDPYLALELAKGQAVPDEAYKLEELDYRRVAEREIVNRSPDWLQSIDQSGEASPSSSDDSADWMGSLRSRGTEEEELPTFDNASFSSQTPSDWFTELADTGNAAATEVPPPVTGRKRTGLTGLLSAIDVPEPQPEPGSEPDMLASLSAIDSTPTDDSSLDDLFKDEIFSPEDATPSPTQEAGAVREVDPLAWAKESGVEVSNNPLVEDNLDLFGADDDNIALQGAGEVDPLAWLKGSGDEDIITETDAPKAWSATAQFSTPAKANTDDDPMAWLSETDIELTPSSSAPSSARNKADSDDPLDWLSDESLLDEALNLEALTESPTDTSEQRVSGTDDIPATAEKPDRQEEMADDKDNAFDWMNEDSPKAESGNDDFTWLGETATSSNEDLPDLFANLGDNDDVQPAADALDWMSELDDAGQQSDAGTDDVPSWLTEMKPEGAEAASTPSAANDSEFEWMSQAVTPEEEDLLAEPADDTPDWLAEMQPDEPQTAQPVAQSSADDSEFEWMSKAVTPEEEDLLAEPVDDTPDWLAELQPDEPQAAQPVASTDDSGFEWMSQVAASENEDDAMTAESAGDTPDWLAELQPDEPQAAQPVAQSSADDSGFEWMSQVTEEEDALTDEPVAQEGALSAEPAGEMPDWLSEMQPAAEAEAEPVASTADNEFAWMGDAISEEDALEDEAVAQEDDLSAEMAGEMPDWLSEMQPSAEAEAEPVASAADDEFEWMSQATEEEDALTDEPVAQEDNLSAEPAGEMPDWLSEMQPAAQTDAEPVAQSAADSEFEWMSQVGEEEDALAQQPVAQEDDLSAEMAGEMPDWLSEMQPAAEEEDAPADEPVAQEDDLSAEPAGEMPDWLSEMQPTAEHEDEPVAQSAADSGIDWGSDSGEQARQASVEEPDWIQTLQTSEKAAVSAEATSDSGDAFMEPRGAVPEWLAELQAAEAAPPVMEEAPIPWDSELEAAEEQEAEPAVADEMPDWLQEVKSSRAETPAPVEEMAASSEYEWIDDINTPETQPEPEPVQELSFDDDYDLISADDDETTEAEPAVVNQAVNQATNAPDWLNAMVPGLDVDYDAPEDEQIEQEFLPGSENRVVPIFQGASQPARNREFQWLTDIVDEETQQMKAIPANTQRGRFTFSQLPAWLRKPKEKQEQPPSPQAVGEDDDWSDVDLPPWLQ